MGNEVRVEPLGAVALNFHYEMHIFRRYPVTLSPAMIPLISTNKLKIFYGSNECLEQTTQLIQNY